LLPWSQRPCYGLLRTSSRPTSSRRWFGRHVLFQTRPVVSWVGRRCASIVNCSEANCPLLLIVRGMSVSSPSGGGRTACAGAFEPDHCIAACLGLARCLACLRSGHRECDCWKRWQSNQGPLCSSQTASSPRQPLDHGQLLLRLQLLAMVTRLHLLHALLVTFLVARLGTSSLMGIGCCSFGRSCGFSGSFCGCSRCICGCSG
jgi:hypothetical protein